MDQQLLWRRCMNLRRDRKMPFACGAPPDQSAACPAIELSAVAEVQSDSTRPVSLNDGTTIPLTRTSLVTSADISGATASLTVVRPQPGHAAWTSEASRGARSRFRLTSCFPHSNSRCPTDAPW